MGFSYISNHNIRNIPIMISHVVSSNKVLISVHGDLNQATIILWCAHAFTNMIGQLIISTFVSKIEKIFQRTTKILYHWSLPCYSLCICSTHLICISLKSVLITVTSSLTLLPKGNVSEGIGLSQTEAGLCTNMYLEQRPAQPFQCCGPLSHKEIYCGPQTFCNVTNPLILISFTR